jgi:protein involved in polysaccharide export with SLBB domain
MRLNSFTILWIFILILSTACSTTQTSPAIPPALKTSTAQEPGGDYLLMPGDVIEIKFFYHPELSEKVTIGPDGKISLQLIDEILAAGLTASQLDESLTQQYSKFLKNCFISVFIREYAGLKVYVGGEVVRPGLLTLKGNMSILQSILEAGGFKNTAKPEHIVLIRKGQDNKPMAMAVDLKPVVEGEHLENDVYLMQSDIVYVPKTWVAKAGDFSDQYLKNLFYLNSIMSGVGSALGYSWFVNP